MSSDPDSVSTSPDSRSSNFNDRTIGILSSPIDTDMVETQSQVSLIDSWWLKSERSTPESHIAVCPGPTGHGQGAPAYSCGCYRWNEEFKPLLLEQVCDLLIM